MFQDEVVPVYERKTEIIENALHKLEIFTWDDHCIYWDDWNKSNTIHEIEAIGFAGVIYPYVKVVSSNYHTKDRYIFDSDEMDIFFAEYSKEGRRHHIRDNYSYKNAYEKMRNNKFLQSLFLKYKVPIFRVIHDHYWRDSKYGLEVNPELKPLDFVRVLDPYTAMQELHMYLNNELALESQGTVPVGSDEVIRDSKGFYDYSFKTLPGGKKRRKNK
jgi:hypothetical protein